MKIALIAHDRKKDEMVNFVIAYEHVFSQASIVCDRYHWKTDHGTDQA